MMYRDYIHLSATNHDQDSLGPCQGSMQIKYLGFRPDS